MQLLRAFWRANQCGHCLLRLVNRNKFSLYSYHLRKWGKRWALIQGREALFWHYEIGGRHFFGEGHLLERRRLVQEIRYSLIVPFSEQTSSYLKYLMNSCILHSEPSILRLLHSIVTLLIPQILHSYEFEFEILILVVVSYCGVSNVGSWRPLFINTYSNIVLPIIYLFFIYFIPIVIKSSHALFLAVV